MVADLLVISIGAILINNFVLVQFLGICPFLGVSKKVDTSVGMGFAVVFVMACCVNNNMVCSILFVGSVPSGIFTDDSVYFSYSCACAVC